MVQQKRLDQKFCPTVRKITFEEGQIPSYSPHSPRGGRWDKILRCIKAITILQTCMFSFFTLAHNYLQHLAQILRSLNGHLVTTNERACFYSVQFAVICESMGHFCRSYWPWEAEKLKLSGNINYVSLTVMNNDSKHISLHQIFKTSDRETKHLLGVV